MGRFQRIGLKQVTRIDRSENMLLGSLFLFSVEERRPCNGTGEEKDSDVKWHFPKQYQKGKGRLLSSEEIRSHFASEDSKEIS